MSKVAVDHTLPMSHVILHASVWGWDANKHAPAELCENVLGMEQHFYNDVQFKFMCRVDCLLYKPKVMNWRTVT